MQLAVLLRIGLHALIHIGIDAVGILIVEGVIFRFLVFLTGKIEETAQLTEACHHAVKLLELAGTLEDFQHIALHLGKQVFEHFGEERDLIKINVQMVYLFLHTGLAVVYVVA